MAGTRSRWIQPPYKRRERVPTCWLASRRVGTSPGGPCPNKPVPRAAWRRQGGDAGLIDSMGNCLGTPGRGDSVSVSS